MEVDPAHAMLHDCWKGGISSIYMHHIQIIISIIIHCLTHANTPNAQLLEEELHHLQS